MQYWLEPQSQSPTLCSALWMLPHMLSVTQESLTMVWPESCTRTTMWQIESHTNSESSCTDVNMARLRGTLLTVAHWPPTLSVGGVSGQPHSIRCAWSDSLKLFAWRSPHTAGLWLLQTGPESFAVPGTSISSALETFATIALYKLTYTIYHTITTTLNNIFAGGVWSKVLYADITLYRYSSHCWVLIRWAATTFWIAEKVQQGGVQGEFIKRSIWVTSCALRIMSYNGLQC